MQVTVQSEDRPLLFISLQRHPVRIQKMEKVAGAWRHGRGCFGEVVGDHLAAINFGRQHPCAMHSLSALYPPKPSSVTSSVITRQRSWRTTTTRTKSQPSPTAAAIC